jgi:hypothetical protein
LEAPVPTEDDRRQDAIKRLRTKQEFRTHLAAYLIVNTGLVVIWAASGAGYFWPIWPMLGWGIAVVFHAWSVFGQQSFTDEDIRAEMERE